MGHNIKCVHPNTLGFDFDQATGLEALTIWSKIKEDITLSLSAPNTKLYIDTTVKMSLLHIPNPKSEVQDNYMALTNNLSVTLQKNHSDPKIRLQCVHHRDLIWHQPIYPLAKWISCEMTMGPIKIVLFAWLISRTFSAIFLSQQISQQYFQSWLISQANRNVLDSWARNQILPFKKNCWA